MGIFENTIIIGRKTSMGNTIARYACGVLAVICVALSLTFLPVIMLLPAIIFGVIWYFLKNASEIEYEYCYIDGELTIDRIRARKRRKKIAAIEMEDVLIVAPSSSPELNVYHNNNGLKKKDASSGEDGRNLYEVVYKNEADTFSVLFEPNEQMLKDMRIKYMSKVRV